MLHLNGITARVLERDAGPDARTQGGSLDISEDQCLHALRALGLAEEFTAHARPPGRQIRVLDQHATVLLDLREDDFDAPRPEIDRVVLRRLLLDSLSRR